jgi:hypothetical protein
MPYGTWPTFALALFTIHLLAARKALAESPSVLIVLHYQCELKHASFVTVFISLAD